MKFAIEWLLSVFFCLTVQAAPVDANLTFLHGQWIAHLSWIQPPKITAAAVLSVEWRTVGSLLSTRPPGSFKVDISMPDSGMDGMMYPDVSEPQPRSRLGDFQVGPLYFSMPGQWRLDLQLTTPAGIETQSLAVDVH
jgi:hypothetical protein